MWPMSRTRCFNGAAAVTPRKQAASVVTAKLTASLQWSRGGDAAETPARRRLSTSSATLLQWSRGGDAAETPAVIVGSVVEMPGELQWSRGGDAAETPL